MSEEGADLKAAEQLFAAILQEAHQNSNLFFVLSKRKYL